MAHAALQCGEDAAVKAIDVRDLLLVAGKGNHFGEIAPAMVARIPKTATTMRDSTKENARVCF